MSIHAACQQGSLDEVRNLVQTGMDLEARNEKGRTPLYTACSFEHYDIAEYLLKAGAKINATFGKSKSPVLSEFINRMHHFINTPSPLSHLIDKYERICIFLIQNNANCHQLDEEGLAPIHLAVIAKTIPVFKEMLKAGGNIALKSNTGRNALHFACIDTSRQSHALLQFILEGGEGFPKMPKAIPTPDILTQRELGERSPFCFSLINATDEAGKTPLHIAAESSLAATNLLIKAGAKLLPDFNGKTPLDHINEEQGYFRTSPKIIEALQAAFLD